MKKNSGVTLITIVIMVIIVSIIGGISIITSNKVIKESKERNLKQNQLAVETIVSRYSAKAATSGVLSPANQEFPGIENPSFEQSTLGKDGKEETVSKNIGEDWYLLSEDTLEELGITYVNESYLVNYKKNVVIPLSSVENIFEEVEKY